MRRGDVYWAAIEPRSGSEQRGRRPVVVLSHDGFNQTRGWRSIIVVPLSTSQTQRRRGLTAVPLEPADCGLAKTSLALCHQITTLDRAKLRDRVGQLPQAAMQRVEAGLKAAIDIE